MLDKIFVIILILINNFQNIINKLYISNKNILLFNFLY